MAAAFGMLLALAGAAGAESPVQLQGQPAARPTGPGAKLDAALRAAADRAGAHAAAAGAVEVVVRTSRPDAAILAELAALGLAVERADLTFGLIEGRVPAADLLVLAAHPGVIRVRRRLGGHAHTGAVTSQGDAAARLDEVRALGLDGSGVLVGVISDGMDGLEAARARGDLPAIRVPADGRCTTGSGSEGTAVLEVVHDVAPGATLAFASGVESPLVFANAVRCLVDAGARVLVDDLGFFAEPYFEDGVAATAVREAVAAGVSYHTAAGNGARLHLEEQFRTSPDDFHDFLAGDTIDNLNEIEVAAGGELSCVLQWNERFGLAGSDYDLSLRDPATLEVVALSNAPQSGAHDPLEIVTVVNERGAPRLLGVAIQRASGRSRTLKLFCFGDASGLQYATPAGSIVGHPSVPGALAVAAIDIADPRRDAIRLYSARGPTRLRFPPERRDKPDLAAFDGVATSVPGFAQFFGTSAAAAHSAGLAALLLQRNPFASGADLFRAIRRGAVDIGPAGFDSASGAGRLSGPGAVARIDAPACATGADCANGDTGTTERCEGGTCVREAPRNGRATRPRRRR